MLKIITCTVFILYTPTEDIIQHDPKHDQHKAENYQSKDAKPQSQNRQNTWLLSIALASSY